MEDLTAELVQEQVDIEVAQLPLDPAQELAEWQLLEHLHTVDQEQVQEAITTAREEAAPQEVEVIALGEVALEVLIAVATEALEAALEAVVVIEVPEVVQDHLDLGQVAAEVEDEDNNTFRYS